MTFVQQTRGRAATLLVDGGDVFFGSPSLKAPDAAFERKAIRNAKGILFAYEYIGYDAVALGPSDLQFGLDRLKEFLSDADLPIVCSNLVSKETGETVFQREIITTIGGVRFGIFSVMLDSLNPSYEERVFGDEYELLDPREVTRAVAAELRGKVDVVVALSHLDKPDNLEIAEQVDEIDVIIDPYSLVGTKGIWITEGDYFLEHAGKPVARIDGQGSRVGVLELEVEPEKPGVARWQGYDYPLEPQIFHDPEIERILAEVELGRTPVVNVPPEKRRSVRLLAERFLGEETCGTCHEDQFAFWRSTKHASAYETLEAGGTEMQYDCIECHTTGYGVAWVDPAKVDRFENVQCESCHGVNLAHADSPKIHRMGEVPDRTCWGCHNPSFTRIPFEYDEVIGKVACPKMKEK